MCYLITYLTALPGVVGAVGADAPLLLLLLLLLILLLVLLLPRRRPGGLELVPVVRSSDLTGDHRRGVRQTARAGAIRAAGLLLAGNGGHGGGGVARHGRVRDRRSHSLNKMKHEHRIMADSELMFTSVA